MYIFFGLLGHRNAFDAGILHRDVSDGNILIADDPSKPFKGFLTDFDYSMFADSLPSYGWTGTLRFVAVELLFSERCIPHAARHDLESFYWVLIAMVLQYTKHTLPPGAHASLFNPQPKPPSSPGHFAGRGRGRGRGGGRGKGKVNGKVRGTTDVARGEVAFDLATALKNQKIMWFYDTEEMYCPLTVRGNVPLSELLSELRVMFWKGSASNAPGYVEVTYATLLRVLDGALEKDGWPENDSAMPAIHH